MSATVKHFALGALLVVSGLAYADAQFLDIPAQDIPDAMTLSRSLEAVMDDASVCRQEERELTDCLCDKPSIERMSQTYETMIDKHPKWAGKTLRFDAENKSHAIQLPTYKQELRRIEEQCG